MSPSSMRCARYRVQAAVVLPLMLHISPLFLCALSEKQLAVRAQMI
jgi:hypothetical protein